MGPGPQRFNVISSEAQGADNEVNAINLAEKVSVTTTDVQKLQAITGSRKNLHFEGTVCSDAAPWINQTVRGCLARSACAPCLRASF